MNTSINWQNFPESIALNENEIHIVRVFIPEKINYYDYYWDHLNSEEKDRASRFRFDEDREQNVIARGILRKLLSFYLPIDPTEIEFTVTNHGKLYLAKQQNSLQIQFNVSHSNQCIIYAVTLSDEIGVDV